MNSRCACCGGPLGAATWTTLVCAAECLDAWAASLAEPAPAAGRAFAAA